MCVNGGGALEDNRRAGRKGKLGALSAIVPAIWTMMEAGTLRVQMSREMG